MLNISTLLINKMDPLLFSYTAALNSESGAFPITNRFYQLSALARLGDITLKFQR